MNSQVFANRVKNLYARQFPDSLCHVDIKGNLYRCIVITCYLAKDRTEVINGIMQNDMFHISFCLDSGNNTELPRDYHDKLPNNLELNAWHKMYTTIPDNKYHVYGHKTITFRKSKGNAEKILVYLDKVFKGMKQQLINDLNNGLIHSNHAELLQSKLKG